MEVEKTVTENKDSLNVRLVVELLESQKIRQNKLNRSIFDIGSIELFYMRGSLLSNLNEFVLVRVFDFKWKVFRDVLRTP